MGRAFNPNFGGLNHNVWLHVVGKIYQTLPLYENLQTTGVHVHAQKIDVNARTAEITVEAQVRGDGILPHGSPIPIIRVPILTNVGRDS